MNLNMLTEEEVLVMAQQYHNAIKAIDELIDAAYTEVHRQVCQAKGVFASPCQFVTFLKENNPLNSDAMNEPGMEGGYCLGVYDNDEKVVAVNIEGAVRMVIERTGKCNLELAACLAIDTLAHELTHYIQDMAGEPMELVGDYYTRPHEVEAREVGKYVTKRLRKAITTYLKQNGHI